MTTIVPVQIRHLDLGDTRTVDRMSTFDNATFGQADGLALMTVYVEEGQPVAATVIEATRKLANAIPGALAVRVHPDLVSVSEIAQRIGISREAVRKWTINPRLHFPLPFDTIGADQRVWLWVEIADWLWKVKGIDTDDDLASVEDIAHIDACISRVPDHTTAAWITTSFGQQMTFQAAATEGRRPTQSGKLTRVGLARKVVPGSRLEERADAV